MPPEINSASSSNNSCVVVRDSNSKMDLKLNTGFHHAEKKMCAKMATLHIDIAGSPNSPCPFVRAMNRNSRSSRKDSSIPPTLAVTITLPQELSTRLDNTNVILVDCRSFMAFNKKHISGALNVNCTNPCFRRRLEKGKTSVGDLITSEEGKAVFRSRSDKEVIVYDEDSEEIGNLPANHPTSLVLKSLKKEGTRASLLKGGLKEFEFYYEGLCDSALRKPVINDGEEPPSPTPDSCRCPAIPDVPATQLLPHLYVGSQQDAENLDLLRELDIDYVLNATVTLPCYHEHTGIRYKRIAVKDNGKENLRCHFEEAFEFIEEARLNGKKVLLHCHAGISRSSTLAIAYIMKTRNWNMMKAYHFVKDKRSIIGPNVNFLGQLTSYEKTLRSQNLSSCSRQAQRSRTSSPAAPRFGFPVVNPET
ncbi:dual specificity protein phosphatase 10-like [Amphiura filiformis]|uniref:dual specificity protein phosphatase 10-like n=1 Tax=Amphiura filiformis TaxID=82378 RepID=UPI003B228148